MADSIGKVLLVVEMKLALINPPSPYLKNDASYPPTGLMYLASKIESLGHQAVIMDMAGGEPLDLADLQDASMIGITCVTPNVPRVKELISWFPEVPVLVGGAHPTFSPLDFVYKENVIPVIGEAEGQIDHIVFDYLNTGLQRIYKAGPPDVSEVLHPARHLVSLSRYTPGGWPRSTVIYTSRGCPYSCRFCSKVHGSTHRVFSLPWVQHEVESCIEHGFRRLVFGDDNIIANKVRMRSIIDLLGNYNVEYRLNQDSRGLEKTMAEHAYQTGCVEISFGIESGSQVMLDMMNKNTTVAKNEETLKVANQAGIKTRVYLIVNFPSETEKTVKETIDFIERTRPDSVLVSTFTPLPGSFVWEHPHDFGINWLNKDYGDYYLVGKDGTPKPTFATKHLTFEQQAENRTILMEGLRRCGY